MLRKSYRLMQKTRTMLADTGDQVMHLAEAALPFIHHDHSAATTLYHAPADNGLGDASRGHDLIRFARTTPPEQLKRLLSPSGLRDLDPAFHRFFWLYDLRAVGSNDARFAALTLINDWIEVDPSAHPAIGTPMVTTERLFRLLGTFHFYAPVMTAVHQQRLARMVQAHLRDLKRQRRLDPSPLDQLYADIGMVAAHVALHETLEATPRYLDPLEQSITAVVLADGGPYTRRPDDLPGLLRACLDLRFLFEQLRLPWPVFMAHAIDRLVPALRFFVLGDGGLASFHGGGVGDAAAIRAIMRQARMTSGCSATLPLTGFERLQGGATTVIMDAGQAERGHHASMTAFECSVGGDRLVVNCGQHQSDPNWQDLLAATSAHSTLTLDHQDNTPLSGQCSADITRRHTPTGEQIELTHTGYETRNGALHRRTLELSPDGHVLAGVDQVTTSVPPLEATTMMIRFHLHPNTTATLRPGGVVDLVLGSGARWQFACPGEDISIDDSVYLAATGRPQKSQQIVIAAKMFSATKSIVWNFAAV